MKLQIIFFLFVAPFVNAQTSSSCVIDVPVGVISTTGALVANLQASAFVYHSKAKLSLLESHYDTGPRRLVFVIDHSSELNKRGTKIAQAILTRVLGHAREGDLFALTSSGNDPVTVPLGEPQNVLAKGNELLARKPGRWNSVELIDAVAGAVALFGEPRKGDAIVILAGKDRLESGKTHFQALYASIQAHRVRVFTVLLGYLLDATVVTSAEYVDGQLTGSATAFPEFETATVLTQRSGGYVLNVNTQDSQREYKTDPQGLDRIANLAWQMYGTVAQFYDLRLSLQGTTGSPIPWTLQIAPEARAGKPAAQIGYPQLLPSCPVS